MRILLWALLIGAVGCQAEKYQALENSIEGYARALKRGDVQAAASFLEPSDRQNFIKGASELEGLMISHVELQNLSVSNDKKSAVSTYLVELFSMYGSEISVVRRDFNWRYDDKAEIWRLTAVSPLNNSEKR